MKILVSEVRKEPICDVCPYETLCEDCEPRNCSNLFMTFDEYTNREQRNCSASALGTPGKTEAFGRHTTPEEAKICNATNMVSMCDDIGIGCTCTDKCTTTADMEYIDSLDELKTGDFVIIEEFGENKELLIGVIVNGYVHFKDGGYDEVCELDDELYDGFNYIIPAEDSDGLSFISIEHDFKTTRRFDYVPVDLHADEVGVLTPKGVALSAAMDSGLITNGDILDDAIFNEFWEQFMTGMNKHGYISEGE